MQEQFKPGDKVVLKSGGPEMTVVLINREGTKAMCKWFNGSSLGEAWFEFISLEKSK